MRKLIWSLTLVMLVAATVASAQVRGRGRVQGVITDKESGKPIAGARVTVAIAGNTTEPITAKSDAKGRWSALGLVSGQWHVDIEADGYATSRGTVSVSELQMIPPIKTELAREVRETASAVPASPSVPPQAVSAVNEAQDLMKLQAGDVITRTQTTGEGSSESISHTITEDEVRENHRRAAALLEEAIPKIPADTADLARTHVQLKQLLSQAWYKGGDLKKAILNLEQVVESDPANHGIRMLLVNLYLEDGQLPAGKALLDRLPAGTITDPTVYSNVGILFMNRESLDDALSYFSQAVELDPSRGESYYLRGLAYLQKKDYQKARTDLERAVALAPDSGEAAEARQLLAQMK
jgi:predicted Zn-dependent protease